MLVNESCFSILVTDAKNIYDVLNLIEALDSSKLRLSVSSQTRFKVIFNIESNINFKTIDQWKCGNDLMHYIDKLEVDTSALMYRDEDHEEGFLVTLSSPDYFNYQVTIEKKLWMCGK